jgi:hypothetical protein
MSTIFYINAKKTVELEQVEIEAPDEETAIDEYLRMARAGNVSIVDCQWYALDKGDLDIENHGSGEDAPF